MKRAGAVGSALFARRSFRLSTGDKVSNNSFKLTDLARHGSG